MYNFFDSYYYENELISINDITFEKKIKQYPLLYKIFNEIAPELDKLIQLRKEFMNKYKYVISFHPFYTLYDDIKHPDISLHRRKEKFLDSRLSLSIASRSKAKLISFNNSEQIFIPDILKKKKVSIEKLFDFTTSSEKIFSRDKPRKNELNLIIKTLTILNNKIQNFINQKLPFSLLANEDSWDRVFFKI
jgi:hypothetical protein